MNDRNLNSGRGSGRPQGEPDPAPVATANLTPALSRVERENTVAGGIADADPR